MKMREHLFVGLKHGGHPWATADLELALRAVSDRVGEIGGVRDLHVEEPLVLVLGGLEPYDCRATALAKRLIDRRTIDGARSDIYDVHVRKVGEDVAHWNRHGHLRTERSRASSR